MLLLCVLAVCLCFVLTLRVFAVCFCVLVLLQFDSLTCVVLYIWSPVRFCFVSLICVFAFVSLLRVSVLCFCFVLLKFVLLTYVVCVHNAGARTPSEHEEGAWSKHEEGAWSEHEK